MIVWEPTLRGSKWKGYHPAVGVVYKHLFVHEIQEKLVFDGETYFVVILGSLKNCAAEAAVIEDWGVMCKAVRDGAVLCSGVELLLDLKMIGARSVERWTSIFKHVGPEGSHSHWLVG